MTNRGILQQTAKDLMNKDLFPKYALSYLKDPNMMQQALKEYEASPMKSFRCPECGITLNAPKTWVIQHCKIHHHEVKENESIATRINPYMEQFNVKI
jgi:hypothetical protein